jgi:hypothetical protein
MIGVHVHYHKLSKQGRSSLSRKRLRPCSYQNKGVVGGCGGGSMVIEQ